MCIRELTIKKIISSFPSISSDELQIRIKILDDLLCNFRLKEYS